MVYHQYHFIDVNIGWSAIARVFAKSTLYQIGQTKKLPTDWKETMNPLVLQGFMKAFLGNGHPTQEQKQFNYHLSRT